MGPFRRRTGRSGGSTTISLAGAGAIAVVHALAAPSADCRVTAVASAGGTSARHLAGQLDADRVRPEDLPAGADLLVVASPPGTHAELALRGLRHGAAVLVEKPFATTLADADRLVDESRRSTGFLRCAENLLHAPAWRAAATARSAMGPLQHLSARALQPPPTWGHFGQPLTAGGVLFDLGPHPIALVGELAGSTAVGVSAVLSSSRDDGADDDASVQLRFASGLVATVEVSWTAPEPEWSVQAAAADGVVRLDLYPEVTLEVDGEQVDVADRFPDVADPRLERMGYVDQLRDMADGVRGRRPVGGQSPDAARAVLEVICGAYASAGRDGDEVALPFAGDRTASPLALWRG